MPTPSARSGPRRWLSADGILCVLAGGAVVYAWAVYAGLAATRPSPADYAAATAWVRAHFEPGDVIALNPFWAERARETLGDLPLLTPRHPGEEDMSRWRRLWLLSFFGAERRPEIATLAERDPVLETRRFGRIDVRLHRLPEPAPLRYDFRDRLEDARVWLEQGAERRPCGVWEAGRARCSPAYWSYVGREIVEIGGAPREVVWAHPVTGWTLVIEYSRVPLGRTLAVTAGFDPATLRYDGGPVTLAVLVDGRRVLERVQEPHAGYVRTDADTAAEADALHTVTFRITTPNDRWRHFCFDAEARG